MALTADQWNEIAVLYKVGDLSIRDIAAQFGITHGAIQQRAKRENWERGSLKSMVNQLAATSSQISQMIGAEQAPIVSKIIRDKAQLKNIITDIFGDAIELQQTIVAGTLSKLHRGEIDELQAAKVLQSLGLGMDSISKLSGISTVDAEPLQDNKLQVTFVSVGDVMLDENSNTMRDANGNLMRHGGKMNLKTFGD